MSPLSPERWRIVSPFLDRLLDLEAKDRRAAIDALRAEDPALALDLEVLLEAHFSVNREGFLEDATPLQPGQPSLAGLVIGAYTLRSLLGQGGMGSVWLADRTDGRFTGQAAIKLLNASLIGEDGEGRFKREGNLLARLRHPQIAQLIDAGVSPLGQPYLVLEYVNGARIDRYCDDGRLSIHTRVRLFLDMLSAVAFAHANLIVHRDLKPPNVLVAKDGNVKLLDFGIAKLLDTEAGAPGSVTLTREGESALTPDYAAPEQLTGGAITTATDVYALGVVLYVLLTGQHPAGSGTTSPSAWIKAVIELDAPHPSDAVVTDGTVPKDALAENAARRSATPEKLKRKLRGDLDNIVAKALKKSPGERYPSVESMAADLRRYLNDEPVAARADSLGYRAAKFMRRNRGGVVAAALVLAAIVAGTAGIAWQAHEARVQRDAARTQLARASATNEFISFLLSVAAPAGQKFSVGELLAQGESVIDKQFAKDPAMKAEMLVTVGEEYMLAQSWDKAKPALERAAQLVNHSTDPALRARAECPLALLKIMNGDRPGAETMIKRALDELPEGDQYTLERAICLTDLCQFSFFTDEAEPMIRNGTEAIALLEKAPIDSTMARLDAQGCLAYGYYLARQNRKADAAYQDLMASLTATGRDRTLIAADTLNNWSLVHFQGNIAKAEPLCRGVVELHRAIEGKDAVMPTATFNYAGTLLALARYTEAEPLYEETIKTAQARQEARTQLDAMMELSELYIERGELERAAAQLDKLTPFLKTPTFDVNRRAFLDHYTGRLAQARGDPAAARTSFLKATAFFDKHEWKLALNVSTLIGLARAELALGNHQAALDAAGHALALAQTFVEKDAPSYLVGLSLAARGDIELAQGQGDAARLTFKAASEHLKETLGPSHPATVDALKKASI